MNDTVVIDTPSTAVGLPTLRIDRVTKSFQTAKGKITAVDDVSLDIRQGEFISIIGPSGCGKSTLMNMVGGLIADFDGQILLDGKAVRGCQPSIGMVFQEESTFPWRTAIENVAFPLEAAGMARDKRVARARDLLDLVGLTGFENHYPAELSGGMRQRIAIARTLAFEPRVLLMDEPFAALDEQTRLLLGDKVVQIQQQLRQTTMLITHNISEAVQLSDRVLIMTFRPGRIKRVVDIDLPRPRSSEMMGSEKFAKYVAEVWNDLREEASKGLRESEAAAGAR
ncbi:MAG: nitrate transporter ATP-binding protein [Hyphomicrobiales bacterium]|nr:nitrate transporter ATP-binding protein [Hyphomicrobiales bacterium]